MLVDEFFAIPDFFPDVFRVFVWLSPWTVHRQNMRHLAQWPFQDPKVEVPTINEAYIRPM